MGPKETCIHAYLEHSQRDMGCIILRRNRRACPGRGRRNLATGLAVSLTRRPDPSLRYAAFRMTNAAQESVLIRIIRLWRTLGRRRAQRRGTLTPDPWHFALFANRMTAVVFSIMLLAQSDKCQGFGGGAAKGIGGHSPPYELPVLRARRRVAARQSRVRTTKGML